MLQLSPSEAVNAVNELINDAIKELERLRNLHQKGELSEEEQKHLQSIKLEIIESLRELNDQQIWVLKEFIWSGNKFTTIIDDGSATIIDQQRVRSIASKIYAVVKNSLFIITKKNLQNITINQSCFVTNIEQYIKLKQSKNAYDLVTDVRNKFLPTLKTRCSKINILGTSINTRISADIDKLFIDLSLENNKDPVKKITDLENDIKESIESTKDLKILIQGKQGSGKTTLLKHIAVKFAHDDFQNKCIPIFISLKRFSESKKIPDLFEYATTIFSKIGVLPTQLQEIFSKGKALLLLDGLDASPGIFAAVSEFIEAYRDNKFVITCNGEQSYISDFTKYKIKGFEENDITEFVTNWFKQKSEASKYSNKLISEISKHKNENDNITGFASSPLLLQFLCLIYENNHHIENIGFMCLYQKAMFALIEDWDDESGCDSQDKIYKNISSLEKMKLISHLAIKTLATGKEYVPFGELSEYVAEYISKIAGAKTHRDALLSDAQALINSIEIQDGLLIQRLWGEYTFAHATIQDFFVSWYINSNPYQCDTYLSSSLYKDNPRWQQIFQRAKQLSECDKNPLNRLITSEAEKLIPAT